MVQTTERRPIDGWEFLPSPKTLEEISADDSMRERSEYLDAYTSQVPRDDLMEVGRPYPFFVGMWDRAIDKFWLFVCKDDSGTKHFYTIGGKGWVVSKFVGDTVHQIGPHK